MKLLVLLLVVVLVVAAFVVIARTLQARAGSAARAAGWELDERSERGRVVVRALRPGSEPLVVGDVAFDDPEFELRIEELRAEGRSRLIALNSGRPPGRR